MPDGLAKRVKSQSSPLNIYFRLSCLQCSLLRTHLLLLRSENLFTLRGGVAETYPILFQNRRVQKSPFLCVNRIPIKYDFSFLRKRHPVQCEPFSSPEPVVSWSQQIKPSGTGDENECEYNLAPEEALFVAFFRGARASSRRGAIHARIALSLFA